MPAIVTICYAPKAYLPATLLTPPAPIVTAVMGPSVSRLAAVVAAAQKGVVARLATLVAAMRKLGVRQAFRTDVKPVRTSDRPFLRQLVVLPSAKKSGTRQGIGAAVALAPSAIPYTCRPSAPYLSTLTPPAPTLRKAA